MPFEFEQQENWLELSCADEFSSCLRKEYESFGSAWGSRDNLGCIFPSAGGNFFCRAGHRMMAKVNSPLDGLKASRLRFWLAFIAGFIGFGYMLVLGGYTFRGVYEVQLVGLFLAFLIICYWVGWRWRNGWGKLPRTGLEWVIVAGICVVFLSLLASPDWRQGVSRTSWVLGYALLFFFFIDIGSNEVQRKGLLAGLGAITGLILFQAVLETFTWYQSWFQVVGGWIFPTAQYRFNGLLMSGPTMGLVNLLVFGVAWVFYRSRQPGVRLSAAVWLVFYGLALPFSSSRSGWLGFAAGIVFVSGLWAWNARIWIQMQQWSKKRLYLLGLVGLIALTGLGFLGMRFLVVFASSASHGGDPFGTSGRTSFWANAVEIWKAFPWLGTGPGRFALEYLRVEPSSPPSFWPMNAHNTTLQALVEFGLVGLAAWLGLAVVLVGWGWRNFQRAPVATRGLTAAFLAGLFALGVQLFFDELSSWMAVMVPAIFLLSMIFQARFPDQVNLRHLTWSPMGLLIPAFVLLGVTGWELWAYQPFAQRSAAQTEWHQAAEAAAESARRDPAFHFYQVQAGMLWAWDWQVEKSPLSLSNAREAFGRALVLEPSLSWLWADLAMLDQAAGEPELALAHFNQAIAISPEMPVYVLNRAIFYEKTGALTEANRGYREVLRLRPEWNRHPFWQSSSNRQAALYLFLSEQGNSNFTAEPLAFWQMARRALEAGQFTEAQHDLELSRLMGEPALAVEVTRAQLAKKMEDWTTLGEAKQSIRRMVDLDQTRLAEDIDFYYSSFIAYRSGTGINLVPGFVQLSENVGQFEMLK